MSPAVAGAEAPSRRRLGWILALLAFAQCIYAIDYSIVFVALPEIRTGIGFSAQTLQWVVSAYAVAFGGFLLLGGRAADLFGRRRMFIFGLFLYAVSSLVGGLAGDPTTLIVARAVQGIGGAFLAPSTLSLVTTTFAEGPERNRALAIWGGAGGSGMILGSLLGGVLTGAFGWASIFFANVPLAGGAMLLAFAIIPKDTDRTASGRKFDLPGALTATIGSTLLVFTLVQGPVSGWTSPTILITAAVAVAVLAAFVTIEGRGRDPLLPLRLFRNRNLSTGTVVTFIFMGTFGALPYFYTLYWQTVHGYSATKSGIAFLLPCVGVLIGNLSGGKLATRFGVRATLTGALLLGVAGTVAFAFSVSRTGSYLELVPGVLILSLGQGTVFTAMYAAATTGVAAEEQGIASGVASTGQQVGAAVGLAVLVAVANSGHEGLTGEALRVATAEGVRSAMWATVAGIVLIVLVVMNFRRSPQAPAAEEPERQDGVTSTA
ncbi:MFS transporter [Streptomyces rubradiris]|uniref:MFS transporter n=1 Tax=Streptomyces rubradiris TaxID=285531 RepID=A0ABQ3R4Y8_STRRR|nr:MFS transporter [Streptomyces rubradiris]GHH06681.1 MFS transporter [Streptomyces rubradiris]GHI50920.1 MFS transporter [Streptomyces rubradiris]